MDSRESTSGARARFEELFDDAHRLLGSVDEMQRKLKDIRVTMKSEDGLISATVDARYSLVDLALDARIYRTPNAGALAARILDTVRRAKEKASEETEAILKQYVPRGMDVSQFTKLDYDPSAAVRADRRDF